MASVNKHTTTDGLAVKAHAIIVPAEIAGELLTSVVIFAKGANHIDGYELHMDVDEAERLAVQLAQAIDAVIDAEDAAGIPLKRAEAEAYGIEPEGVKPPAVTLDLERVLAFIDKVRDEPVVVPAAFGPRQPEDK